jgi:hypothetical protein
MDSITYSKYGLILVDYQQLALQLSYASLTSPPETFCRRIKDFCNPKFYDKSIDDTIEIPNNFI